MRGCRSCTETLYQGRAGSAQLGCVIRRKRRAKSFFERALKCPKRIPLRRVQLESLGKVAVRREQLEEYKRCV